MSNFLAAMAVVKVNYDSRGQDVLQMLVPFVADCARSYTQPLSDQAIQRDLSQKFSLPVPRTVVKSLLHRLRRAGALEREHGVFRPVRGEIDKPEYDLSASMADVHLKQAALLVDGVAFASRVFDLEIDQQELSGAISKLVQNQVAPLAAWAIQGEPVVAEALEQEESATDLAHIAAQYILHVIEDGNYEHRTALEQIAKGSLLAAVLWSTDVDAPDRRIDGLEIFLDTTLLLRLLGLCGPTRQAFSEELSGLAQRNGVSLVCFEHTRDEIVGILSAATVILRHGRADYFGEAIEYMVAQGWGVSDVEEVIATLDDRLADCGVDVRPKPARVARYNMDEDALRDLLNKNVQYSNPAALDADVDSFASIFILRRAAHSSRLESSRAVFVTTNSNLALSSRQLYTIGEDSLRGVPLVLLETQVASYLWARRPSSAEGLPLSLLATGALSIAESEPSVWRKYVGKIDELRSRAKVSEREYVLLRQSLLARSILMAVTEGDADAFSEDTADFVLKHALAEHTRELQSQMQTLNEALTSRDQLLAAAVAREQDSQLLYGKEARRAAKRIVVTTGIVISLILLLASIASYPWPVDPPVTALLPAWLSITLGVLAALTALASIGVGFTLHGAAKSLIERLARVLEKRYRSRFSNSD